MEKKIVYLDMDGPTADFDAMLSEKSRKAGRGMDPPEMFEKGFFLSLPVQLGAREAIRELLTYKGLELFIASKPSTKNLWSATEKYQWIDKWFPELLTKIFLTCDKGHLSGDYLIDDDKHRWGDRFNGTFLHFRNEEPLTSWKEIVQTLSMYKDIR